MVTEADRDAFQRYGDVNKDGIIDLDDIMLVGAAYAAKFGEPKYNPYLDLNSDRVIDIDDYGLVIGRFGTTIDEFVAMSPRPQTVPPVTTVAPLPDKLPPLPPDGQALSACNGSKVGDANWAACSVWDANKDGVVDLDDIMYWQGRGISPPPAPPTYPYRWVWKWSAFRHLPKEGMTDELLKTIEAQLKQQLLSHPEITSIQSIDHSDVKFWTSNLGLTGNWSGTTTTVFRSTAAPASPAVPAILIAIIATLVIIAIIAAIFAFIVYSVDSTITELAEKAPLALTLGAGALLVIAVVGGYFLIKERKPIERVVARAVPVAERGVRRAVKELHIL